VNVTDSDSSIGEYEDASESLNGDDDMLYIGTVETTRKLRQLSEFLVFKIKETICAKYMISTVPEDVDSEIGGSISFMEEYERRYGCEHPLFLQGTLDEAVKEAFNKPAREVNSFLLLSRHFNFIIMQF